MVGLPNPWVILGAVLAVLAMTTSAFFYGRGVGVDATEVVWQAREAKINAASAEAIKAAQDRVITAERASAARGAETSAEYQRKLKEKDREKATALAIARGLRIGTTGAQACGNAVPPVGPGTTGRDGETSSELSRDAAEFFIGEANRADKIVEQLNACQAIVAGDRMK